MCWWCTKIGETKAGVQARGRGEHISYDTVPSLLVALIPPSARPPAVIDSWYRTRDHTSSAAIVAWGPGKRASRGSSNLYGDYGSSCWTLSPTHLLWSEGVTALLCAASYEALLFADIDMQSKLSDLDRWVSRSLCCDYLSHVRVLRVCASALLF